MTVVLGVDGGNTKTVALVSTLDGEIIGRGRSGCGDIYGAPTEAAALANVRDAIDTALTMSGARCDDVAFAMHCLAGADWPEDHIFLEEALRRHSRGIEVCNDGFGALRAGSPSGEGVAIVCGTYAAIVARGRRGISWNGSFWQEPCGAVAVAQQVLHAVYRADLGIEGSTGLTARVLTYFGRDSVAEVVHHLTSRGDRSRRKSIAGLARPLLEEADTGDDTALRIVTEHARLLSTYAFAAARKAELPGLPYTVVLGGGMLKHRTQLFRTALMEHFSALAPEASLTEVDREPVIGALLLALDRVLGVVPVEVLARLDRSVPPKRFFTT